MVTGHGSNTIGGCNLSSSLCINLRIEVSENGVFANYNPLILWMERWNGNDKSRSSACGEG
jgi:hypothetical protein